MAKTETIPNPQGTLIQLDRARYIKFSFNALCEIKKELDMDVLEALQEFEPFKNKKTGQEIVRLPFFTIRCFLWAGLLRDDHTVTIKQVGELIEDYFELNSPVELIGLIMSALEDSKLFKQLIKEGEKVKKEGKDNSVKK